MGEKKAEKKTTSKVKKSKTGRVHTQTKPLNDTGVRLAMLKKIVPFNFDDFMTLTHKQYGEKYGKPTPMDMMNHIETKSVSNLPSKRKKIDAKKKEIGFNPQPYIAPKAKTDIDVRSQSSTSSLTKAQRRRQRKKMTKTKLLTPTKISAIKPLIKASNMTKSNLLQFGIINDDDSDDGDALMKQMSKDVEREKKEDEQRKSIAADIDSKSEPEKSEIDKMIEEDLRTTFHETAHLISSLSAQRTIKSVQYRLHEQHQQNEQQQQQKQNMTELDVNTVPSMDLISQSLPVQFNGDNVRFGTMFDGQSGTLFGNAVPSTNNLKSNKKVDVMPPIAQEKAIDVVKKNVKDAWHGEWLTPENFKPIPKNEKSKKRKIKNVEEVKNLDSSVAVITVDTAMQRCMVNMGLRVMSTSKDRQYGGGSGEKNKAKAEGDKKEKNAHNNGEPVQYV